MLFVDDTNLWSGLEEDSDVLEVAAKAHGGVNTWGKSLIATGGILNPPKCNFTIHDMVVDTKGKWTYADAEKKAARSKREQDDNELDDLDPFEEVSMGVPRVNGNITTIKQLKSSETVKNLGLFARPDGDNIPHMQQMRARMEIWTTKVKNGALPTRSVWSSYTHQLYGQV